LFKDITKKSKDYNKNDYVTSDLKKVNGEYADFMLLLTCFVEANRCLGDLVI
jgi:hypothetical protein